MTPRLSLKVVDSKYATTELNVRTQASAGSSVVAVVKKGTKLSVTKTIIDGFRYVSYHDKGRWVKNQYLSDTKPKSTTSSSSSGGGGISGAPCPGGSSVESGLTPDAIRVHRAVCHRYPQVTSFLGGPVFERLPRGGSCSGLHDLRLVGRLGRSRGGSEPMPGAWE